MAKFELNKSVGHLLRRAQQYSFDKYSDQMGNNALTPRQFAVLHAVSKNEGLSQTDLVKATGIDRSTLADMISRMIKKGLLTRKRTKADARANAVSITASGKKSMTSAEPKVTKADDEVLKVLAKAKQGEFVRLLQSISSEIDKEMEAAAAKTARRPAAKRKTAVKKKKTVAKKRPLRNGGQRRRRPLARSGNLSHDKRAKRPDRSAIGALLFATMVWNVRHVGSRAQ